MRPARDRAGAGPRGRRGRRRGARRLRGRGGRARAPACVLADGERIAGGRRRPRRRAVERARWPRAPASPLPLEPRKGQLVRLAAPRAGPGPAQGRRRLLPALGRSAPAAGLEVSHGRRDDVGGRRARRLVARAARLRHVRRRRRERRDGRARRARCSRALAALPVRGARGRGCGRGCPTTCRRSGRRARVPGLWLATGHEGAGVALGPVTGRLVAQLLCGEAPVVDPAPFDPDRFARRRGPSAAAGHLLASPTDVTTSSCMQPRRLRRGQAAPRGAPSSTAISSASKLRCPWTLIASGSGDS